MSEAPISREELSEFFADKGVDGKCESCGQTKWSIYEGLAKITPLQGPSRVLFERYLPAAVLSCTNCGNMRFYAHGVIEEWRKNKTNQR